MIYAHLSPTNCDFSPRINESQMKECLKHGFFWKISRREAVKQQLLGETETREKSRKGTLLCAKSQKKKKKKIPYSSAFNDGKNKGVWLSYLCPSVKRKNVFFLLNLNMAASSQWFKLPAIPLHSQNFSSDLKILNAAVLFHLTHFATNINYALGES